MGVDHNTYCELVPCPEKGLVVVVVPASLPPSCLLEEALPAEKRGILKQSINETLLAELSGLYMYIIGAQIM